MSPPFPVRLTPFAGARALTTHKSAAGSPLPNPPYKNLFGRRPRRVSREGAAQELCEPLDVVDLPLVVAGDDKHAAIRLWVEDDVERQLLVFELPLLKLQ